MSDLFNKSEPIVSAQAVDFFKNSDTLGQPQEKEIPERQADIFTEPDLDSFGEEPTGSADPGEGGFIHPDDQGEGEEGSEGAEGMDDAALYDQSYALSTVFLDYVTPVLVFGIEKLVNALPTGYVLRKRPDAVISFTAKEKKSVATAFMPLYKKWTGGMSAEAIFAIVLISMIGSKMSTVYEVKPKKKVAPGKAQGRQAVLFEEGDILNMPQAIAYTGYNKNKLGKLLADGMLTNHGPQPQTKTSRRLFSRSELDTVMGRGV
jgi:hypothetical protein